MSSIAAAFRFEAKKFLLGRSWIIVAAIVVFVQPMMSFVESLSMAGLKPGTTPAMDPDLAATLPPLPYYGLDVLPFGQVAIVVLGAIVGASEYRHGELRTTLLSLGRRSVAFWSKLTVTIIGWFAIGVVSVYVTLAFAQLGLGKNGLNPWILSPISWREIAYYTLDLMFIAMFTAALGMISRNMIVPMVVMIPQAVVLGGYVTNPGQFGRYLPVAAGNLLVASPTDPIPDQQLEGFLVLLLWTVVALAVSWWLYSRRDVGGSH